MLKAIRTFLQWLGGSLKPRGQPAEPEYSTRVVERLPDDSWIAELSCDGVPYARMRVYSISNLLKHSP